MTIIAGPRWGTSTPERWTPYVITVKNQASADFEGEVVLVPEPVPPLPPGPAAAAAAAAAAESLFPPLAWKIGARTVTTPRAGNRGFVTPDPAEFPLYRVPMVVALGSEKTVNFMVLQAPAGYRAELRDSNGKTVGSSPPEPLAPAGNRGLAINDNRLRAVLVLSRNQEAKVQLETGRTVVATQVSAAADVPDDALSLSGLSVVVIDDFDTVALSPSQWSAIRHFVSLGGGLVLGGGAGAEAALKAVPQELLPLQVTGSTEVSMAPVADLVDRPTTVVATVTTGELKRGRPVVATADGIPLVVSADYGTGRVVQLAYDPLAVFSADPVLGAVALDQGVARVLSPWGSGFQPVSNAVAPEDQLWDPAFERARWPTWPSWSLWMLLVFAAAVALITTVAVRTPRRARLMWLALPLAVVFAAMATVAVGAGREDDFQKDVVIKTAGADGTTATTIYRGLAALRPRRSVGFAEGTVTSRFIEPGAIRTSVVDEVGFFLSAPPRRGDGKGTIVVRGESVELDQPVRRWQARTVQHVSIGQSQGEGGIEAHLRLAGITAPPLGGMRVQGGVTNHTAHTLRQLRAQLPEGGQARLADTLDPGATVTVDVPIVWATPVRVVPGNEAPPLDLLLFAAASRSFTGPGQVALVAEEAPPPGSDGRSTTIVVQPTPLEQAGWPLAHQATATRIASVPGPDTGALMTTYDYSVTPGHAPLSLAYAPNPAVTRIEVYDWAARTWRSLPTTAPPPPPGQQAFISTPVNATESLQGLVRVRAVPNFTGNLGLTSPPPPT